MSVTRVIVLISVFVFNYGFLLEDKGPQQSSSNNQYISMSKYLADQSSMHHELETFRRQQEMTMSLLTSQLKQKLAEMETKISEKSSRNNTCKVLVEELEQNYQEVKQNNTRLAGDLEALQSKYSLLSTAFMNSTTELKSSHLKNIQQLQSLHNLQEEVHGIKSSVTFLQSHEQARNQDFLALYNITMRSEAAIYHVSSAMNQYQTDLQNEIYNTIIEPQRNVSNKVALTACVSPRTQFSRGDTIQFTDIRTNIGYTNISSFQSTGQFVCTVSDTYHISVVLMSQSKRHAINIFQNNNITVSGWMDDHYTSGSGESYWNSAAAVTVTWLDVGDTVRVTSDATADIEALQTSCLTIVQIG